MNSNSSLSVKKPPITVRDYITVGNADSINEHKSKNIQVQISGSTIMALFNAGTWMGCMSHKCYITLQVGPHLTDARMLTIHSAT